MKWAVLRENSFSVLEDTKVSFWFCGTKTCHKVLAHPSHPLAVRVNTFRGRLHTASSWLVAVRSFPKGDLFVFQRVCDQANLH